MRRRTSFDYAIIRVVPREERIQVDEARLRALWPEVDVALVRRHLEAFPLICFGDAAGGPIARLSQRERFHWLVAPRSTMIQVSAVHTGLSESGEKIFGRAVG